MAAAKRSRWAGRTRPTVARNRALGPASKYSAAQFGGNGSGEFAEGLAVLDEDVQVLGGIRVERGCQNATVAEGARAELHAALQPGDNAVVVQLLDGVADDLVGRDHVMEA